MNVLGTKQTAQRGLQTPQRNLPAGSGGRGKGDNGSGLWGFGGFINMLGREIREKVYYVSLER